MPDEVLYKIDEQVVGPRPLQEVRNEIRSGMLPADTPLQLTSDHIWTDLAGLEQKKSHANQPGSPQLATAFFLTTNAVIAGVGYFWLGACLIGGGLLCFLGVLVTIFEDGRRDPFWTAAAFLPLVHSREGFTPIAGWLILSGLFQLVLFFIFS